jgi:Bacterial SH3 domain
MQLARWIGVVGLLVAGTALAAQGDALLVTGSNVNVRAGPSTAAGILARVGVDEPAIERRRQGEWVEVELPNQDVLGWIHGSLLDSAETRASAAPRQRQGAAGEVAALELGSTGVGAGEGAAIPVATAEESAASPLGRFRREVEHFNDRAVAAAGIDLFTGVAPLDEGGVQVVTTDAWAFMSEPGQRSYLNALFERWQRVAGPGQARLQIVDANGALMMEKSGP